MTRVSCIYSIAHVDSGREYIGQTVYLSQRWARHRRALNKGTHHNAPLQAAWLKYGADAFVFEILLICSPDRLTVEEQRLFDERKPRFNVAPVAGSSLGVKQSAQATAKKLGRRASPETRAKMSAASKGHITSPEQRAKIAAALTGRKRPPEVVEKMRAAFIGRKLPAETRAKMSLARTGKKHSPQWIANAQSAKARRRRERKLKGDTK